MPASRVLATISPATSARRSPPPAGDKGRPRLTASRMGGGKSMFALTRDLRAPPGSPVPQRVKSPLQGSDCKCSVTLVGKAVIGTFGAPGLRADQEATMRTLRNGLLV